MADYVKVATTTELPPGKMKKVQHGEHQICLANANGKHYAIAEHCTHVGGPLSQGTLNDHTVTCPWHGSQFDLTNGQVKRGPARLPVQTYEVKTEGTDILVKPHE